MSQANQGSSTDVTCVRRNEVGQQRTTKRKMPIWPITNRPGSFADNPKTGENSEMFSQL